MPPLQAKLPMLLQPHRPTLFYLLSPEAFRLTAPTKTNNSVFVKIQKMRVKACQFAGPGVWPVRMKRSNWLDVWLLCI